MCAGGGGGRLERGLDLVLGVVVELEAVGREQLDAVVLVGVVRGRDHGREVEPVAADQQRRGGRRQDAGEQRVASGRGHARGDRRLEHLAGLARVADDQDLRALVPRASATAVARQRKRELGRQEMSRAAADAVRAEELARHDRYRGAVSAWRTAAACGPS